MFRTEDLELVVGLGSLGGWTGLERLMAKRKKLRTCRQRFLMNGDHITSDQISGRVRCHARHAFVRVETRRFKFASVAGSCESRISRFRLGTVIIAMGILC